MVLQKRVYERESTNALKKSHSEQPFQMRVEPLFSFTADIEYTQM